MAAKARHISRFTKAEIDTAFKTARRVVKHPGLHLLLAPAQQENGRILLIVSKKVGNAPERNLIKRRLKSVFFTEKLFKKGYDCIAIAKPGAAVLSFDELKGLLLEAFSAV